MPDGLRLPAPSFKEQPLFFSLGFAVNLLIVSFALMAVFGIAWEYSTREYLRGFSDAIVPFAASPEQKAEAILGWMSNGPARNQLTPSEDDGSRDPVDNLNYATLLQVCGTATNAFVNLADASDLQVRRLLLLAPDGHTSHVVAEVHIAGRWVVIDPSFRTVLKDSSGNLLTKEQLANPETFRLATSVIPHYDPGYNYVHTAHIHLGTVPVVGKHLQRTLDSLLPTWDESMQWTLLAERQSYAVLAVGLFLLLLSLLLRRTLDFYGRKVLGVGPVRLRVQLKQGGMALLGRPLRHL